MSSFEWDMAVPKNGCLETIWAFDHITRDIFSKTGKYPSLAINDVMQAFDCPNRQLFWDQLRRWELPHGYINFLRELSEGVTTTANWGSLRVFNLKLLVGFFQGGVLSIPQFKAYSSELIQASVDFAVARNWYHRILDRNLVSLKYWDDNTFIQYTLDRFVEILQFDSVKMYEK